MNEVICINCKNCKIDKSSPQNSECKSSENYIVSKVTGERTRVIWQFCEHARQDPTCCGAEAKWFLPKE